MAAEVTHIVLAKQLKDKFYPDLDPTAYFIGTVFPDIRYVTSLDRDQTHLPNFDSSTTFGQGLKIHSQIDQIRSDFLVNHNIRSFLPNIIHPGTALKILEDRLIYDQISNWSIYVKYLDQILSEEIAFGLDSVTIKHWHQLLQNYFSRCPDYQIMLDFSSQLGFNKGIIDNWEISINALKDNQDVVDILDQFHNQFLDLYQKSYTI